MIVLVEVWVEVAVTFCVSVVGTVLVIVWVVTVVNVDATVTVVMGLGAAYEKVERAVRVVHVAVTV